MVAAMSSVGVDGAIMVSSFSAYEYDPSYALEVYNTFPDKFRVVTPVDATDPAIDDVVAKWAATPGARGIRLRMRDSFTTISGSRYCGSSMRSGSIAACGAPTGRGRSVC
jgi:hypothetical protein